MAVFVSTIFACGGSNVSNGENSGTEVTSKSNPNTTGESSASASQDEEDIGELLATVGDIKIGSKEWMVIAARQTPKQGSELSLEEKEEILNKLIDHKLLYLKAKEMGIDRDPKVQKLMVQTLMRKEVYAGVRNADISPEELKSYFESHPDEFVVPEKVQVRRILIKAGESRTEAQASALAEKLRKEIVAAPEKFKELAKENSEDPYRKRGGDLGFVSKDGKPGVPAEVTEKAFGMKVGDVSEVFVAGGGHNIVTVINRRERVERTFEQMKGSVLRKVKNEKYRALYDEFVASIREPSKIKRESKTLSDIEVKAPHRYSEPAPTPVDRMPTIPRAGKKKGK
jgi:parvulin-like peptidyl-prolyl isomerase